MIIKYRTPSIDEFVDGFKYEMYDGYTWVKQIYPNPWWRDSAMGGEQTLNNCIEANIVRVRV